MSVNIHIPRTLPVMTLPNTVLFPHAMLPLRVFEERYREMLQAVLHSHRIFAVAHIDDERASRGGEFEPPHSVATVGIVRACHDNEDDTSTLVLQGLARVKILEIVSEHPYRMIRVQEVRGTENADPEMIGRLRSELTEQIHDHRRFDQGVTDEVVHFLTSLEDPEVFLDLVGFTLCSDSLTKQVLLETEDLDERYRLLTDFMEHENDRARLEQRLRKGLSDDDVCSN